MNKETYNIESIENMVVGFDTEELISTNVVISDNKVRFLGEQYYLRKYLLICTYILFFIYFFD